MKQSELLRKQADMIDMAEKYGIDDWKDLISVDNSFGVREKLYSIDWLYSYDLSKPKFALGVVEGKPVFEGDIAYVDINDEYRKRIAKENGWHTDAGHFVCCYGSEIVNGYTWTPPKPKTVMVELLLEDVEHWAGYVKYQSNIHAESVRLYKACLKSLEEQK